MALWTLRGEMLNDILRHFIVSLVEGVGGHAVESALDMEEMKVKYAHVTAVANARQLYLVRWESPGDLTAK